jgi:ABC-type lipoprotein release transport system permease subunit
MSSFDVVTMCVRNLFKRKVRTFLTVIGVVAGTASIVLMISLGIAANMNFERQLELFDNILDIELYNWSGRWGDDPNRLIINDALLDEISSWDGVEIAYAQLRFDINVQIGRRTSNWFNIVGVRPEAMALMGLGVSEGRLLQEGDDEFQIVFGSEVLYEFMTQQEREAQWREWMRPGGGRRGGMIMIDLGGEQPERDPPLVDVWNEKVLASFVHGAFDPPSNDGGEVDPNVPVIVNRLLEPYEFESVGVLDNTRWQGQWQSYMNITIVQRMINEREVWQKSQGWNVEITDFEKTGYDQATVRASDFDMVEGVFRRLNEMGFDHVWSPIEQVTAMRDMSASLQRMLFIIGMVSLFVAFIGIANTMIMAIYERTKEIGVMKVIGASLGDIAKLFLFEAAMFGAIGGAIGLAVSYFVSDMVNNAEEGFEFLQAFVPHGVDGSIISYIPTWLYVGAFAFSAVVGLVAGFLPAMRAMRISALTAIRTD